MRKKNRNCFCFMTLLFCFLCFSTDYVLAASNKAEVSLTIQQKFEVKNHEKDADLTGNYEIRALDQETPMPEDEKENLYSFSLNGVQAQTTISLKYVRAGVYCYQLSQSTKEKEGYQYDRSCYDITVYVKNGEGGQLIPQVIVEKEDGKKYGELEFKNAYQGKNPNSTKPVKPNHTDKPVKTGDLTDVVRYVFSAVGAMLLVTLLIGINRYKQKK